MRKIVKESMKALFTGKTFRKSNMEVTEERELLLHGNRIAYIEDGKLFITDCGWQSNTTKDRLNAFPTVAIHQKSWEWFLFGEKWDGRLTEVGMPTKEENPFFFYEIGLISWEEYKKLSAKLENA